MADDVLSVELNGNSASLDAVLERVTAALQTTDAQGVALQRSFAALGSGDAAEALRAMDEALGKVGADTTTTTQATLAESQAEARLAVALGDRAGAIQILENALSQQSERTLAVIRAETQLASIENQVVAANEKAAASAIQAGEANATAASESTAFSSAIGGMLSPIALATAGIAAAIGVVKSFGDALHVAGQLQEERTAFGGILGDFNKGNTILDEAIQRGKTYGFTQTEITAAFKGLAPIIRESTSSTQAQTEALARISTLDPAHPVELLTKAIEGLQKGRFAGIAAEMGLTKIEAAAMAAQVAHGADAFTVLNAGLDKQGITLAVAQDRMQGYAGAERTAAQAQEDLTLAQAAFAAGPGRAVLDEETRLVTGLTRVLGGGGGLAASFQAIAQNSQDADTYQLVYNQSLEGGATAAAADAAGNAAVAQMHAAVAIAAQQSAGAYNANVAAVTANSAAVAANTSAMSIEAQALVDETTKKLDSAQAAERLTQFQTTLANLGTQVAGGMQTAGAAAATLASQYHIATDEALKLIQAQAALAQAKVNAAALVDQRAGERDPGSSGAQEAQAAEDRRLQSLYRSLEDTPKKARAAGGVRLSDQQKLNNQLQADQVSAANKSEDAESKHEAKLLDIQKAFDQASLAQQQSNEISKRQSQADFYDRLTSSDLNKKKGGSEALKQIDADYQAAYKKSQELAAAGNQKEAADYLALKQKQAEEALTYQENLAKAEAAKDAGEVSRLQAIQKLRLAAQAEEEKQLLRGGDTNVNKRDAALADEATKNDAAQDKIATAAERASARQITAAEAAGKKIDENTLRAGKLGAAYDRVAPTAGGNGAPSGGSVGASAPTDDPTLAALSALQAAVVAAVKSASDTIAGAVRSSSSGKFAN